MHPFTQIIIAVGIGLVVAIVLTTVIFFATYRKD